MSLVIVAATKDWGIIAADSREILGGGGGCSHVSNNAQKIVRAQGLVASGVGKAALCDSILQKIASEVNPLDLSFPVFDVDKDDRSEILVLSRGPYGFVEVHTLGRERPNLWCERRVPFVDCYGNWETGRAVLFTLMAERGVDREDLGSVDKEIIKGLIKRTFEIANSISVLHGGETILYEI